MVPRFRHRSHWSSTFRIDPHWIFRPTVHNQRVKLVFFAPWDHGCQTCSSVVSMECAAFSGLNLVSQSLSANVAPRDHSCVHACLRGRQTPGYAQGSVGLSGMDSLQGVTAPGGACVCTVSGVQCAGARGWFADGVWGWWSGRLMEDFVCSPTEKWSCAELRQTGFVAPATWLTDLRLQ